MIKYIIIASLLSTFGVIYLYYKLSDCKKKIDYKAIIVYFIGVAFTMIVNYYEIPYIGAISYFIYFPILFYFVNPLPIKKLIFYVCTIWVYGILLDFLSMVILSITYYIFKFNVDNHIFKVIPTIMAFIFFVVISKLKWVKKLTNFIYSLTSKVTYLDFVLVAFSIFTLIISLVVSINVKNLSVGLLLVLTVLLIILVFVLLIKLKFDEAENKIFLETLKANNDFYIKMEEENRIFKHNLVAKLTSIKSVSNSKAIALIDDLVLKFDKNIYFSNNIKEIPYGINGIIYERVYPYLDELEFKIVNDIDFDIFNYLTPKRYNVLTEKLVLLLDNAIESTVNSLEKVLLISISDMEDSIEIDIKNTFANEINIDDLGNKSYSTKGKKRGLGLFSIFRNKEVNFTVKIVNNYFETKLVAKKNKNV